MLRICAMMLVLTTLSAVAEVPIKDFVRKSDYFFAKISPKGDYLALSKPHDDSNAIFVIDLKDMKVAGAVSFGHGQWAHRFWWVGPDRIVIAMAKLYGPLDQPYLTGELVAMNADGGGRNYLVGYRGQQTIDSHLAKPNQAFAWTFMLDTLVDDNQHVSALMWDFERSDHDPIVIKLDAYDGTRRPVAVIPAYEPVDVLVDNTGEPLFAYGADRNSDIHFIVPGKDRKGWKELDAKEDLYSVSLHQLSRDQGSAFVSSSDSGGTACLREFSLATADWKSVACNPHVDVSDVAFDYKNGRPIAVTFEDGKPQVVYPDPENPDARLLRALQNSFKGQRLSVTSATDDGSKLVVLVDSDRNPGDFYLVDRATKKAQYLLSRRKWIDPAAMSPSEPIRYQTRDGASIDGYLTSPAGLATKAAPLVLLPHGGPHGPRDFWEWGPWAQVLASRGYAVLQVNYRGSGGYGHAHESAGYKKWGTLMQDDLTDAVKWASAQGIADPKRVCIFGASYGGYAAIRSVEREPDLYRCAIAFAGVYDLVTEGKDADFSYSLWGGNGWKKIQGDAAAQLEQSPVTHVADLKVPVLIAHGTADRRVPFSQAKELRDALKKAGKPFEWMEFDGEEHGFWKEENEEAFFTKVLAFLNQNIGPGTVLPAAAPAPTAPPAK